MKRRSRLLNERISHKVIVTLKTGEAFVGILWEADDRLWVLRNAEALSAGKDGAALPLDGELIVLSEDVLHIQRP